MAAHVRHARQPRLPHMRQPADDQSGPRPHLTGVYLVVEAETSDGVRTRLHEERHPPDCVMCGQPLEVGGVVRGRMTMNSAGRIGFICTRHH